MQYLVPILIGISSALITIVLYLLFTRQTKPKAFELVNNSDKSSGLVNAFDNL